MPAAVPAAYRLNFADWLALPDDGRLYELIDGELLVTPTPSVRHQRIARNLTVRIQRHLEAGGRGEVLFAPMGVRFSDERVVEPDLVVVLTRHRHRIGEQHIEAPPDLVVEILSPGTAGRDLGPKRELYAAGGVPEYWIVDPAEERIEVLELVGEGYVTAGEYRRGDSLRSPLLPELEIVVDGVFPEAADRASSTER
jgi:Uma2 family endonuclease